MRMHRNAGQSIIGQVVVDDDVAIGLCERGRREQAHPRARSGSLKSIALRVIACDDVVKDTDRCWTAVTSGWPTTHEVTTQNLPL